MTLLIDVLSTCFSNISRALALADAMPLSWLENTVTQGKDHVCREYWTVDAEHVGKVETTPSTQTIGTLTANIKFEQQGWHIGRQLLAAAVHDLDSNTNDAQGDVFVDTAGRSVFFESSDLTCFTFDETRQGYVCSFVAAKMCTERDWCFAKTGSFIPEENRLEAWRRDIPWV